MHTAPLPLHAALGRAVRLALVASLAAPAMLLAQTAASAPAQGSVAITLPEAIRRAEANEPTFALARAQAKVASLGRGIARTGLLPSVVYNNNVLYTQPNGIRSNGQNVSLPPIVFVANNSVHEYVSQASITETAGLAQVAGIHLADATAARTAAELEVARRGLAAAVANLFFGVTAGERRLAVLQSARDEAAGFVQLTQEREAAREAAHADVVKADLTLEQRERDLRDGVLARDRARLELAVLLFTDPLTPFTVEPSPAPVLPAMADVEAAARRRNPELSSAMAAMRENDADVLAAKAALLPDVSLNFAYGIDATDFAKYSRATPETAGIKPLNLGYSISGTVNIPIWDWLATERRIKQTEVRRDAGRVALTAAQRRLIVNLQELYAEAVTARDQLASLDTTVRTAEESLRLAKMRYASGEALALEVVDAETSLYTAQSARIDGDTRYRQALTSLQTLTGAL